MGYWGAPLYDATLWSAERLFLADWRRALLGSARGTVLEIGAGTGLNLPHYPAAIDRLLLCEPDDAMRERLRARVAAGGPPVELRADRAEALDVADGSIDVVVGTLVLCTVADPVAALAEVRRVLAPGGRFLFLEHVAADHSPWRHALQRALEPGWRVLAGNCHLCRPTERTLREAAFELTELESTDPVLIPPFLRPFVRGVARPAATPAPAPSPGCAPSG